MYVHVMQRLWIPGKAPSLNELLRWKNTQKGRFNLYAKIKRSWGKEVAALAKIQGVVPIDTPASFSYTFVEPNRKRDPSNFIASGVKIVEDALQEAKLLKGDGWAHVGGIMTRWTLPCDDYPDVGIEVEIYSRKKER